MSQMRHCYHSVLAASAPETQPLEPDYVCALTKLRGRPMKPCRLYLHGDCDHHEPFPERYND